MWTKNQQFKNLVKSNRWNVEFYAGVSSTILTSNYSLVQIGDIVKESRASLSPRDTPSKLFPYLALENVASLTGDLVSYQPTSGSEIRSRCRLFHLGNVLYGRLRPYLNKVFVAEGELADGICTEEFLVLVPDDKLIVPYILRYMLASPYILHQVAKYQTGAALPRIPSQDLMNMQVPVPPLDHQIELEKHLRKLDERRRGLARELSQMPNHAMSILLKSIEEGKPSL